MSTINDMLFSFYEINLYNLNLAAKSDNYNLILDARKLLFETVDQKFEYLRRPIIKEKKDLEKKVISITEQNTVKSITKPAPKKKKSIVSYLKNIFCRGSDQITKVTSPLSQFSDHNKSPDRENEFS